MKQKIINIKKLTKNKWLNLFEVQYVNSKNKVINWSFASRKKEPYKEKDKIDAVVIIPIVDTKEGKKLVVTKEYRLPIFDYEYGFPAGLIDDGETLSQSVERELKEETGLILKNIIGRSNKIISTAGMSDESTIIVFVEAEGKIEDKHQEDTEDIETFLYGVDDIRKLLSSDKKVGAKAWGVLYYYSQIGKIE